MKKTLTSRLSLLVDVKSTHPVNVNVTIQVTQRNDVDVEQSENQRQQR